MNCPNCGSPSTPEHYLNSPSCDDALKAVWGQRNQGKRKTKSSAGGRPFEPWDGITNPYAYDLNDVGFQKRHTQRKRCRICKGPVLNTMKIRTCQGCRAKRAGIRSETL